MGRIDTGEDLMTRCAGIIFNIHGVFLVARSGTGAGLA